MIKSFLQRTNKFLTEPFSYLAPLSDTSTPLQRVLHSYKDFKGTDHRLKFILSGFNSRIHHWNTLPPSSDIVMYSRAINMALFVFGFMTVLGMIEDYKRSGYPFRLKEKSVKGLNWVVSKFVLFNDGLNLQTAMLIARLCDRERTQYTIMNALNGLLSNKTIVNGARDLSIKFLHTGLLNEEFLYEKAKDLVIRQLRSEDRRKDLQRLLINYMKTDSALDQFKGNVYSAWTNEGFKNNFNQTILREVRNTLDDNNFKENTKKSLQAFLAAKPE